MKTEDTMKKLLVAVEDNQVNVYLDNVLFMTLDPMQPGSLVYSFQDSITEYTIALLQKLGITDIEVESD